MTEEAPTVEVGDRIRLVKAFGDIPAGSEGVVFGFYRRPDNPTVAVRFNGQSRSVPIDHIEVVQQAKQAERRHAT